MADLDVGEKTRITRALARKMATQSGSNGRKVHSSTNIHGLFRCVCQNFFLSPSDVMMECQQCHNWSHAVCMDVDVLRAPQLRSTFLCMFCRGDARHKRPRDLHDTATKAPIQKLTEVPDREPTSNGPQLQRALQSLRDTASKLGFEIVAVSSKTTSLVTDAVVEESLECCASAIQTATFSESYPVYCLEELRNPPHPYLQGVFMRCKATNKVVSLVLSNGMDNYGSLRRSITQIRAFHSRHTGVVLPAFSETIGKVDDVSGFVHLNLIATHPSYRGRGLAKMLISAELLLWALRGRTQVYLNMALDKTVDLDGHVLLSVSPASRRLYGAFEFQTVFQRPDDNDGQQSNLVVSGVAGTPVDEHFTKKEADSGRVMANLNFVERVLKVVHDLCADVAATATAVSKPKKR